MTLLALIHLSLFSVSAAKEHVNLFHSAGLKQTDSSSSSHVSSELTVLALLWCGMPKQTIVIAYLLSIVAVSKSKQK